MFKDLLIRAAIALRRQGVAVSETDLKAIYLYSAFMVYGVDGFQGMTREWPNNSELSFVDCSDHYEFLLQSHHIDEDLSKVFLETSSTKKQKTSHSVKGLVKMADNVINFTNEKVKATENTANYTTKMCEYPECNKFRMATHTSSKCWRQHPELCPDDKKSKFNNRKNNYLRGQRKFTKTNENSQESRDNKKAPKTFIKSARKFLKKRFEANHTGEPDYSLDQNTVINLAYFNYAKANKLKVKASKKIKKLLAGIDDNNSRKVNSQKFNKSNKSSDEDAGHNSSENQSRHARNAGNGVTTPLRSARQRIVMRRLPNQKRQT
jgi:hypothetical protein